MTKSELAILEAAFDEAAALEGSARARYLQSFRERHATLATRLEALLAADAHAHAIADPVSGSIRNLLRRQHDAMVGRRFGAWEVTGIVGAGGMGTVYRARRSDGSYAQEAALKLISGVNPDRRTLERFRSERQILASLAHPGVTRLLDGGADADGAPFLVMELIEGEPIDHYCATQALGVKDRLRLFASVCEAVDYAHRNLVIHRDLKAGNILVTPDGVVKILDFGVAKLLQSDDVSFDATQTGQRLLTPEYASPEQVRGERPTVSTDVYSLGVLLFRLLTGQSPYGDTRDMSAHDMERAILEREPTRPSAVVTHGSVKSDSPAEPSLAGMPVTTIELRRRLSGDLDNIVLKCLQKEQERRYASARALADDVERYLHGLPVSARGDAWTYRAGKFARRNAGRLATLGTIVAGAIAMTVYHTDRLAMERDRAELSARQANEVSDFLVTMYDSASPFVSQGDEVTALDLLEGANARIDTLDDQPGLQARLLRVIGFSYIGLGDFEAAERSFRKGLDKAGGEIAGDPKTAMELRNGLAEAQRLLGDFDESMANRERALAIAERYFGPDHPEAANVHARIGATLSSQGRCEDAISRLERAAAILADASDDHHEARLNAQGVLAVCYDSTGRYDDAERIGRAIVEESEARLGKLEPNTIIRVGNLALVLRRVGRYEEAAALFRTAMQRVDRSLPPEHADRADYRFKLANSLQKLGRFDEADRYYREGLRHTLRHRGEGSFDHALALYYLGGFYRDTGATDQAIDHFARSSALAGRLQGADSPLSVASRLYFASSLREAGRLAEAREAMALVEPQLAVLNADHQRNARTEQAIQASLRGDRLRATGLFETVLEESEEALGDDSPTLVPLLIEMSEHFRRSDASQRAIATAERASRIARDTLPADNWMTTKAEQERSLARQRVPG